MTQGPPGSQARAVGSSHSLRVGGKSRSLPEQQAGLPQGADLGPIPIELYCARKLKRSSIVMPSITRTANGPATNITTIVVS
jgi:hypothetical protein